MGFAFLVVVAELVVSPVAASTPAPIWLRAPGHFVYCEYDDYTTLRCFSSVSGRWVRITGIYAQAIRITTGRDVRLIGFRRPRNDTWLIDGYVYHDNRSESRVICASTQTFFKCSVAVVRFWFKRDGSFRLIRG